MPPVFFQKARKVNNYDLYAGQSWYVPGVGGMFALLAWFLAGNLLGSLVVAIFGLFTPQSIIENYSMLVVYPLSFIPAMLYAAQKSQRNSLFETGYKLNSSHFGPFKGWQIGLITVALTLSTMIAADLPNYYNYKLTTLTPGMKQFYDAVMELMQSMTGGPFWSSFLLTAIFAPVFEEWLCRGMVLRGLLTKMKPGWAIVVSALFFAVIHLNPWQALNAFIIGVIMGYVYYKTGSLLLTMLIHFVNNGFAVVAAQIPSLQDVDYWFEIMPRGVYIGVYVLGVCVLVACILAFRRIPLEQRRGNIDSIELVADGE
ncbi:MAG: CPBP family intramembrane metalloprotease [Bacteroidales bacterium]|nr:CPBP family intramembrane metalloprotease [Bacteroidales bacterium]